MKQLKQIIQKRFKNFEFKKIVLYKNPNEFKHIYIEKVNPTHKGIIWGRRKKTMKKGTNYIKCGKVFFSFIPVMIGLTTAAYIEVLTKYTFNLLLNIGLYGLILLMTLTIMMYYIPFKIGDPKTC